MRPLGLEVLDDGEQVADRAGEAVEPHDDQGFAAAYLVQQARQHWPGAIGTGGVLLAYRVAAGSAPLVELGIGALFLGGDPCVADQTACAAVVRPFARILPLSRSA